MVRPVVVVGVALLIVGAACSDDGDGTAVSRSTAEASTTASTRTDRASTTTGPTTASTVVGPTTSATEVSRTTAAPATVPPATTVVSPEHVPVETPPDADAAASELRAETGCDEDDPSLGYAELDWRPAARGGVQRVQVTVAAGGFDGGDVATGPELDGDVDTVRWVELAGQAVHTWRVITAAPDDDVWYSSTEMRFEGPLCAVDYQDG